MTVVALALAAGWAVTSLASAQLIRALYRQHSRERGLLIDQILHLSGKPWHEAPADQTEPQPTLVEPRRWTATPEQNPIY